MPTYRVIKTGFYDGRLYDPEGKRQTLDRDKPFTKSEMPSWVEPTKEMSPQQKAAATKKANADKAEADKKAVEDQIDINDVTFTEPAKSSTVETL